MISPIKYHGGSNKMLPHILERIPTHITYVEPFAGGASVFFAKKNAQKNYINDVNCNIASLYDAMTHSFDALAQGIERTIYDEWTYQQAFEVFHTPKRQYKTDIANEKEIIHRALATWICCNMGFGGKVDYSSLAIKGNKSDSYYPANGLDKKKNSFEKYRSKIRNCIVLNRDALDVIKRLDSPDAFFYIDPPWIGTTMGHYKGYAKDQFKELVALLMTIEGKFMLHTARNPFNQLMFTPCWEEKVFAMNSQQSNGQKVQFEQLTMNYRIKEPKQLSLL